MSHQQELNLELISLARHNNLKGDEISEDLKNNQHLWVSAYGFFSGDEGIRHLIPLRDMTRYWHIDSLAITCKKEHKEALKAIIKKWNPSEIYEHKDREEGFYVKEYLQLNGSDILMEVWWD
ncbi:MAG: hypothetical protein PHT69_10535 [Bacteroidales bacterium]|nr:hypothetical protein [Bacteroidales bacterium]